MTTTDRTLVLMYHNIGDPLGASEMRYCMPPKRFAAQMRALSDRGYRAVPIDALVDWLEGGTPLRQGDFVLTFDDGFRGVLTHAVPILRQLQWPFSIFLVTDLLGRTDEWNRRRDTAHERHRLLSAEEVLNMHKRGCTFHSHTRTHPSLPQLSDENLAYELADSRRTLSDIVGHDVHFVAYPYGHLDERIEAAARAAGYRAGFSVQPGFNRADVNRFRIRRLDVFGTDTPRMLLRKMRLGSNDGSVANDLRYYGGRVIGHLIGNMK